MLMGKAGAYPLTANIRALPEGKAGVVATLKAMKYAAKGAEGMLSPSLRRLALSVVSSVPGKYFYGEAKALSNFVRDKVTYRKDIDEVETLQTPVVTLQQAAGDCDDKATLLAAMLKSIGHPVRFVAIGYTPGVFEHVYVETRIGENWIPAETTEPWDFGVAPPKPAVVFRYDV